MKKLVYSPGEPSGIGIDLIIKLSNSNKWEALNIPVLTLSDPTLLNERAKLIDQKIKIENIENIENINLNKKGLSKILLYLDVKIQPLESYIRLMLIMF